MPGPRSWSLLFVVLAASLWLMDIDAQQVDPSGSTPPAASAAPGGTAYVGSDACRACHRPAFEQWQRSVHRRMTQSIAGADVRADFSVPIRSAGATGGYSVAQRGDRRFLTIVSGGTASETHEVHYTLGEKRLQGYMSRLPDGRIYVLPLFWHNEWQRWLDWTEITPVYDRSVEGAPDKAGTDRRQIWNTNCFNCHATNIQRRFDVSRRSLTTTWAEMGVGCEACHGPGREHVDRLAAWGKDPSTVPQIDIEKPGADLSAQLAIFVPRTSTPRQIYDSCAYCHGNKTNHFLGFEAGGRLEDFAQLALVSDAVPATDPQGDYWPDGRPSRFNRPQALTMSGCFVKGQATCASCHAAHGSANEHSLKVPLADADSLCTQCHQTIDRAAHSRHAATSTGSSCVACHMSDVNWRLLTRRRDHTFAPPVPELTGKYGIPNACTTCHDDRTPEWAARTMDDWYGNRSARTKAVATADAVTAAASGDGTTIPTLRRLAVDRRGGALMRASAAGFLGRLATAPAVDWPSSATNTLIGAASDPESMVRIAAVRALGSVPVDDRVVAALSVRLVDDARVVRASAAESLLFAGVVTLPGPAGLALRRAQDEYADSLRAFGDIAAQHTSLGWLLAARGDAEGAARELRLAVSLDPTDPRPHVYLGVLSARAHQYDAAVAHWGDARRLNAAYPNLDRLIAEAKSAQR